MAGIGDYVHFHASRYDLFGTNFDNNPSITAQEALNDCHQKLKSFVQQQVNKKLKTEEISIFLTQFVYPPKEGYDWQKINSMNQELFEAAKKELQNAVDEKYSGFEVNLNNLSLTGYASEVDKIMSKLYKYQGLGKNKGSVTYGVLKEEINLALQEAKKGMQELYRMTKKNGDPNLLLEIAKKKEDLENIGRLISSRLRYYKNRGDNALISFKDSNNNLNALGKALQQLNDFSKVNLSPNKKDFGDLAEMAFAYALSVAGRKINKTVNDLTYNTLGKNAVVGDQRSKSKINNFSQYVDTGLVNARISEIMIENAEKNEKDWTKLHSPYEVVENGKVLQSIRETQDTVDISVTLANDIFLENKSNEMMQLNASIKNVGNIYSGVHVLGGSPLLNVLQLGTTDFINHYLNILAHIKNNSTVAKENFNDYQEEVKYIAAVRALSGIRSIGAEKTKYSDAIIINDRAHKKVFVWETSDLLNKLEKLQKISDAIQIDPNGGKGLPTMLINDWKGNAKYSKESAVGRISYLIAQLHQYKLFVTLKLNALIK